MTILAFDPGKTVGWVVSSGEVGHLVFDQIDHGERLWHWNQAVESMLDVWRPDLVAWDQPFARGQEGTVVLAMGKFLEMNCWNQGIKRLIVPMNSVKKAVLGNGRATNTDAVKWAEEQGWKVANHHEADAILLLSYGLEQQRCAA